MEFEQLFENFQYEDLQWFIPVLAGLVIIVGALLIGVIRGMTAGVIVALFFGGLMSLSPNLLDTLQRTTGPAGSPAATDVTRSAAELAVINSEVLGDLSRVVLSMRNTLQGLAPMVDPQDGTPPPDAAVAARFTQSLADMEERLDAAVVSVGRGSDLRARLEDDLRVLDAELRGAR